MAHARLGGQLTTDDVAHPSSHCRFKQGDELEHALSGLIPAAYVLGDAELPHHFAPYLVGYADGCRKLSCNCVEPVQPRTDVGRYLGSWTPGAVMVWNGTLWVAGQEQVQWNGSAWVPIYWPVP